MSAEGSGQDTPPAIRAATQCPPADPWAGELELTTKPPCATLVAPSGRRACKTVPLARRPIVLGRSPEADLQVYDRWVSRRHCEICLVDGQLFVCDLDSEYGTFVNDRQITRSQLKEGDVIYLGMTRLHVTCRHQQQQCMRMRCSSCLYPCGWSADS